MKVAKDLLKIVWWLGWRTFLFMGGIIGVFFFIALLDEVL